MILINTETLAAVEPYWDTDRGPGKGGRTDLPLRNGWENEKP